MLWKNIVGFGSTALCLAGTFALIQCNPSGSDTAAPPGSTGPQDCLYGLPCADGPVKTGYVVDENGRYQSIHYRVSGENGVTQGDILYRLSDIRDNMPLDKIGSAGRSNVLYRWPDNQVPYTIDPNVTNTSAINDAIAHWQASTRIRFIARTTQADYVRFVALAGVCDSYVGRIGGRQDIRLDQGGCPAGAVIHEIGHAIGFHHEQSRADRNLHVNILTDNIVSGAGHNFQTYGQSGENGTDMGPYDFGSIMHYGPTDFGKPVDPAYPKGAKMTTITRKDGSSWTVNKSVLSAGDIQGAGWMYSGKFNPNETWISGSFYGSRGTFFADATGDGKKDIIVVNGNGITIRRANPGGTGFNGNETWTSNGFYGSRGTHFADVTGDGRADAIAVNDGGITVRRANSAGTAFGGNETWVSGAFYGSYGTHFTDVTGDNRADVIVVNGNGITVRRANPGGTGFNGNETWTSNGFYGYRGTHFADVTGDGKADAIAVNDGGITVRRASSEGTSFNGNEAWTNGGYYGTRGTFFADANGDGRADAIAVNNTEVVVRASNGTVFPNNALWINRDYYGSVGTYFTDVTGDGRADAVVVNSGDVTVRRAQL